MGEPYLLTPLLFFIIDFLFTSWRLGFSELGFVQNGLGLASN